MIRSLWHGPDSVDASCRRWSPRRAPSDPSLRAVTARQAGRCNCSRSCLKAASLSTSAIMRRTRVGSRTYDIQLPVPRTLPLAAAWAQIIHPLPLYRTHGGRRPLRTQGVKVSLPTASVRVLGRRWKSGGNSRPWAAPPARCITPRTAISTASRSSSPLLRQAVKTTSSSRLTSPGTPACIA